jgi:hypothetical protein
VRHWHSPTATSHSAGLRVGSPEEPHHDCGTHSETSAAVAPQRIPAICYRSCQGVATDIIRATERHSDPEHSDQSPGGRAVPLASDRPPSRSDSRPPEDHYWRRSVQCGESSKLPDAPGGRRCAVGTCYRKVTRRLSGKCVWLRKQLQHNRITNKAST